MDRIDTTSLSALIGSDFASLTTAYARSGRDRVTLYEADTRFGEHTARTRFVNRDDGSIVGVDSALLVHK